MSRVERMVQAMIEVHAYLADREDVVDGDYGKPEANEEMRLLSEVRGALKEFGVYL